MNTHKGFINLLWLVVALVVIIGGGAAWWANQKQAPQIENLQPVQSPVVKEEAKAQPQAEQTQLSKDLAGITPQFVDAQSSGITSTLTKVKKDVIDLFVSKYKLDPTRAQSQSYINITSLGSRYITGEFYVTDELSGAGKTTSVSILDAVTGEEVTISGDPVLHNATTAVFATDQDLCTYKLDTPACVPLPGAKLSGQETYASYQGLGGISTVATHTAMSFTIQTFLPDPDPKALLNSDDPKKKSRELTFQLPQ